MNKEKRKIKLINRRFQLQLMAKFILLNSLILSLFGILIYIFFKSEINANLASAHTAYTDMSQMILPIVLTLSILNIIVTAIVIASMILLWSHKIAGPLYRLNVAAQEVAKGNLAPLSRFRDTDQLQELSSSFSGMTSTLSTDFGQMSAIVDEIKQHSVPDHFNEKINQLETILKKYQL